jgi:outer membrane immunogenic protein
MITSATMIFAAGQALSADMPVKGIPDPVPVATCGSGTFHGFYGGAHVASVSYRADRTDRDAYLGEATSYSATKDGWGAGAQIGFNWQCHNKLWGFEADWTWANQRAETRVFPNTPLVDFRVISTLQSFGTLRTRTGIIVEDVLLYVTGGLAGAKMNTAWRNVDPAVPIREQLTFDDTRWGWTAGVGAEVALWKGWTFKSEALYIKLQEKQYTAISPALSPPPFSFINNDSIWTARAGLNYHFSWDPIPTVAKY